MTLFFVVVVVAEVIAEKEHITRIAPMASLNEPTISTTTTTSTVPEVSSPSLWFYRLFGMNGGSDHFILFQVDLTQSDSDDDVPIKRNQPPAKQLASNPTTVSAAVPPRNGRFTLRTRDKIVNYNE